MVKAFLAGVSDYSAISGYDDLPFSGNDIRLMASALKEGLTVNPVHIRTAGLATGKVTAESLSLELKAFCSGIKENDILIIYYTGHGIMQDGKHCLLLSDGPLYTDSVLDLCKGIKAESRLLILDCCMSGAQQLNGSAVMDADGWVDDFLAKGYAVFASSSKDQKSCIAAGKEVSLFTAFLADALTGRFIIEKGKKSLEKIWSLVRLRADIWNRQHPDLAQNPVFRSSIGGTVYFDVEEFCPYIQEQFYSETEDYIIAKVEPLHSGIAKRYAVKCILKHPADPAQLARIAHLIVREVISAEVYSNLQSENRWKGKPVNIIFGYFGNDETDIETDNYEYLTTWVDETQDKDWWYGKNKKAEIVDDIMIVRNMSYIMLKRLDRENTGEQSEIIEATRSIISEMVSLAEQVIADHREARNGSLTEEQLTQALAPKLAGINRLYFEDAELKIPPSGLNDWSLACSSLAASIHDLTVVYGKEKTDGGSVESRRQYMDILIERYQENLALLQEKEKKWKYLNSY